MSGVANAAPLVANGTDAPNKNGQFSWIDTGKGAATFNMAYDDALLHHAAELPGPVIRFYGWTEPAATFGYFQHYAEIEKSTLLRPLIRRPTGGGLVPHDADWTYSMVFPKGTDWYELRAEESYRRVHQWLQSAFQAIGLHTELADCCKKTIPGQCFVGYEKFDLLMRGRKLAGAAQRRTREALLIQGSVQPWMPGISRSEWQREMVQRSPLKNLHTCRPFLPHTGFMQKVDELVLTVYLQEKYNRQR